jgi:tetratricopeptide (TPR) repeat protein
VNRQLTAALVFVTLAVTAPSIQAQEFATKAEYDAYLAVYEEENPATKVALGEAFIRDFPESEAAPITYQLLVATHYAERDWEQLLDAAKRFDRAFPDADTDTRMFIYQRAMAAGQQAQQPLDVLLFGDQILEIDRNHLGALLTLPPVILDNVPDFGRARETNLARAFDLASRARVRAQTVYPGGTGDPQKEAERAQVFSRIFLYLGQVHELRGDDRQAADEYAQILRYDPQNSDAYLRIGLAYQRQAAADSGLLAQAIENAETEQEADAGELPSEAESLEQTVLANLDFAIDNLVSAVALGGVASDLARVELERLYTMRNENDPDAPELDTLVTRRRQDFATR